MNVTGAPGIRGVRASASLKGSGLAVALGGLAARIRGVRASASLKVLPGVPGHDALGERIRGVRASASLKGRHRATAATGANRASEAFAPRPH